MSYTRPLWPTDVDLKDVTVPEQPRLLRSYELGIVVGITSKLFELSTFSIASACHRQISPASRFRTLIEDYRDH